MICIYRSTVNLATLKWGSLVMAWFTDLSTTLDPGFQVLAQEHNLMSNSYPRNLFAPVEGSPGDPQPGCRFFDS